MATVKLLVVGGGASVGGGVTGTSFNAGGGGGQVSYNASYAVTLSSTYTITIGAALTTSNQAGNACSFGVVSAAGGATGYIPAHGGGSGSGSYTGGSWVSGNGSGGAGGAGDSANGGNNRAGNLGGLAGAGTSNSITGGAVTYGAGGAGGSSTSGDIHGAANSGTAGGGGGGIGGTGVVIVSFITANYSRVVATGTYTKSVVSTETIYKFTNSGTLAFWSIKAIAQTNGANISRIGAGILPNELYTNPLYSDANLISYYRFEGNSNDAKNVNNGSDTSVSYGTSYGKFNQGASYNGTSSFTDIGTLGNFGSLLDTGTYTFSFWFNSTDTDALAAFGRLNTGATTLISIQFNRNYLNAYTVGDISISVRDEAGLIIVAGSPQLGVFDGSWHFIVWVITPSSNTYLGYVDGAAMTITKNSASNLGTTANLGAGFYIGAMNNRGTTSSFQTCFIDDFAIWDRALSEAEVQSLGQQLGMYYVKKIAGVTNV